MATPDKRLLLELVGGKSAPVELPRQGVLTIGSDAARADFQVDGQGVADVHCAIGKSKSGGFALKDLGSQYGTMVNGKPVTSVRLEPGDVILLGSRRLRVFDPDLPAPTIAAPLKTPTATALRETSIAPPTVRGYLIEKLLGKGGMGEVWLAVQERLERRVALKLLSRTLSADADFVRRFLAEARAAASLSHPNVVVVYDAGEDQGQQYLAMEFMERGNLESRVAKDGALPWKDVLSIVLDAARGLQYAESKSVVHRDIKPANLMQDSHGATKISDLGLASHLDAEATQSEGKKIFGTPHFISPEQARGERVDARSDLYSLGATAYRLLSGKTPFEGATTRDILRGHFTETPKSLAELAPSTPPLFAQAVHRLLAKKPEERYPSAAALIADLERVRDGAAAHKSSVAASGGSSKRGLVVVLVLAAAAIAFFALRSKKDATDRPIDKPPIAKVEPLAPATPVAPAVDPNAAHPAVKPANADDDSKLKVLELKAELAYRDLPKEQDDAARRDALTKLAGDFAGTTVATRALEEVQALNAKIEADAKAASEHVEATDSLGKALQNAISGIDALAVGTSLRTLLAVPGQDALAQDQAFQAKRKEVIAGVMSRGLEAAKAALADADRFERAGDFVHLEEKLHAVAQGLDLPELAPEPELATPAAISELDAVAASARSKLADLGSLRERFASRKLREDARTVAAGLGGAAGFEKEIASLDFAAATTRLDSIAERVTSPDATALLAALKSDVADGRQVLASVAAEFAKGNWRRKTVLDPRRNKGANRNAVSVDATGVSVEVDAQVETIPWSAFGAHPKELHQLFFERLNRDYTADELRAIAKLMRITSVVNATQIGAQMMQTSRRATFSEGELRDLLEGFVLAKIWAQDAEEKSALERESGAADVFGHALRQIDAGQWTSAVSALERLQTEHRDSLLFRLLSGGPPLEDGGTSDGHAAPAPTKSDATAPANPSKPGGGRRQR